MKQKFIVQFYDFTKNKWVDLYSTYSEKLARHQLSKCRACFEHIRYRLISIERIV